MSLTCTLKQTLVNYSAQKHAKTQPLHYSNTRAEAPKPKNKKAKSVTVTVTNLLAQEGIVYLSLITCAGTK